MISIALSTYDVTSPPTAARRSTEPVHKNLLIERNIEYLIWHWYISELQTAEGTLAVVDWTEFLIQVRRREPSRWMSEQSLGGPLDEGGMRSIARQSVTTPSYQLFLAAIDLVDFLHLCSTVEPDQPRSFAQFVFVRQLGELNGFVRSPVGGGRLFFVPDHLLVEQEESVQELVRNGKLVHLTMSADDHLIGSKHYVPYAPPPGFTTSVSSDASNLWDAIRNAYHAR